MKQNQSNALLLAVMTFSLMAAGCSPETGLTPAETDFAPETAAAVTEAAAEAVNVSSLVQENVPYHFDVDALFSERDLSGAYEETASIQLNGGTAEITGTGASAEGSVITVTEEGVYHISGTLDDGRIVVNSSGKVQLVLDNVSISCSDNAAIYIENAKKAFITLAAGSENSVSDGSGYTSLTEENASDAAIFSKDSLTINGTGALAVSGNFNNGITSKDDLVICAPELTVNAVGHGIKGKDYVAISDGSLTITAGGDGIKSSNDSDEGMGFVYVGGGSFNIEAEGDGIQAESELVIGGGTFSVVAGGGLANAQVHTDSGFGGFGGGFGRGGSFWSQDDTETEEDTSVSVKGLKAGSLLYVCGGTLDIEAADDALHSNGDLITAGGTAEIKAGSKGIHADGSAEISGGAVTVSESYEGIEAAHILISGGEVHVTSSDDGFNASDGSSQGAMGGAVDCSLEISGGFVYVNAEGDGLDSNGSMLVSGGIVLVDGPETSGNGALDANNDISCTGGLLIAAGSMGMAEYPTSGQHTIVVTTITQQGNTLVTICDENGSELLSYAPAKSFSSFIVSSPDLNSDETYTVYLGGSSTSAQVNGLYEAGGYQKDGTEEGSVTLDDTVCFIGQSGGGMGGFGGGQMHGGGMGQGGDFDPGNFDDDNFKHGGRDFPDDGNGEMPDFGGNGDFPEDMQPPTDENGNFSMPGDMGERPQGGRGGFMPGGDVQNS